MDSLISEFDGVVKEHKLNTKQGDDLIDDVLSYALFAQVALNFIQNRNNPSAFEPAPDGRVTSPTSVPTNENGEEIYTVDVEGQQYTVTVTEGGDVSGIVMLGQDNEIAPQNAQTSAPRVGESVAAPLAGNVINIPVSVGQQVAAGDTVLILEAMKMETNVSAPNSGQIISINVREGDSITVGEVLLSIG